MNNKKVAKELVKIAKNLVAGKGQIFPDQVYKNFKLVSETMRELIPGVKKGDLSSKFIRGEVELAKKRLDKAIKLMGK